MGTRERKSKEATNDITIEKKADVEQYIASELKENVWYTFSIAPNDFNQFFEYNVSTRYKIFKNTSIHRLKHDVYPFGEYRLHFDVNENGRFHWHGRIRWTTLEDYFNFLSYSIHRLQKWCVVEIDYINDEDIWKKYETKFHRIKKIIIDHKSQINAEVDKNDIRYHFGKKRGKRDNKLYDEELIDTI